MCGRLNQTGEIKWRDYVETIVIPSPRYNTAPTEDVFLMRGKELALARWWLVPSWAKEISTQYSMFNARCEKLTASPAFRGPFKQQRGVVPMSSFIEWRGEKGNKQPWAITNESQCLYAAALWDEWHGGETPLLSCTIITTAAAEPFQPWHHRMPVLLSENEIARWMDNSTPISPDDAIFQPRLKFSWNIYPLAKAAGNSRNKAADIMAPIGETVTLIPEPG